MAKSTAKVPANPKNDAERERAFSLIAKRLNQSGMTELSLTASGSYTQSEIQDISDKMDEIIALLNKVVGG